MRLLRPWSTTVEQVSFFHPLSFSFSTKLLRLNSRTTRKRAFFGLLCLTCFRWNDLFQIWEESNEEEESDWRFCYARKTRCILLIPASRRRYEFGLERLDYSWIPWSRSALVSCLLFPTLLLLENFSVVSGLASWLKLWHWLGQPLLRRCWHGWMMRMTFMMAQRFGVLLLSTAL